MSTYVNILHEFCIDVNDDRPFENKNHTYEDKEKDKYLKLVLTEPLRKRTSINITGIQ